MKYLVDTLSGGSRQPCVWFAFALLVSLIAADNLLWRLAGLIASFRIRARDRRPAPRSVPPSDRAFAELFRRPPARHADGRITATSNAVFTVENMFIWNVLPPCAAMVGAIALVTIVSVPMALTLAAVGGVVVVAMFRLAAAGKPLHHALRRQGGRRRRRDGRRDRQHAAGARVLRPRARASPLRHARSTAS